MMMMMMMMMMIIIIIIIANRPRKYSRDAARQGRTESIYGRHCQPLYGPCMTLEHSQQPARISCVSVFAEGGKPEYPDKNPRSRVENQHKLSPHMMPGPGIEPGPHWWEASALTTATSLFPLISIKCSTKMTDD